MAVTILLLASVPGTFAQTAPPEVGESAQPEAASPQAPLQQDIIPLEVKGPAQFQVDDDADWQALTPESRLGVGANIRTGYKSRVKLQVGPNCEIVLRGISALAVGDLTIDRDAGAIRTMLAKKYGTMEIEVHEVDGLKNDMTIGVPGQVLAVTGTGGVHSGYGGHQVLTGRHGTFRVNNRNQVSGGDVSSNTNPDPGKNAENNTNQTNNSTPGADGTNASGSNPNLGFQGLGAGNVKGVSEGVSSFMSSMRTFERRIPRDNKPDEGDTPPRF